MARKVREILVANPRSERFAGGLRVVAQVNGEDLWFESDSAEIAASPEAFATALLVPALHADAQLVVDAPLDPLWRENVEQICRQFHEWWNYSSRAPLVATTRTSGELSPSAATVQCFSGGCDSFYSLLCGGHDSTALLLVHGFDIPDFDSKRFSHARRSAETVAAAVGKRLIAVRTNLRRHSAFRLATWERTHGGALAAVGHLLVPQFGRLIIPSSYTYADPTPWGSHWMVDKFWASSGMAIQYDDATLYRLDKLKQMASEPLVRNHLRVCYEEPVLQGNCSRCDKCVRTMLQLEILGELANYPVFDRDTPLVEILDSIPDVGPYLPHRFRQLIAEGLAPDLAAAVERLLARQPSPRSAWWRRLKSKVHRHWHRGWVVRRAP